MAGRSAVVIGASAGVGRALADALASRGYDLVLAARSRRDLTAVAQDIETRHGVRAYALELDLLAADTELDAWFRECGRVLPAPDAVLITVGDVDDDDDGVSDHALTDRLVAVNFTGVARVARRFAQDFEARDHGTLVFFSSIAASTPRRRNVAYAAAKSALESYARSLQHRFAASAVRVQVYRLGYVDTAMTRGRRLLFPVARASRVADIVVDGLSQPRRFRYVPGYWAVIVFVLEHLPWPIYRRLEF